MEIALSEEYATWSRTRSVSAGARAHFGVVQKMVEREGVNIGLSFASQLPHPFDQNGMRESRYPAEQGYWVCLFRFHMGTSCIFLHAGFVDRREWYAENVPIAEDRYQRFVRMHG